MWNDLTEHEQAWTEKCRGFADDVIAKHYRHYDKTNAFPQKVHDAAYDQGLMNVALPQELGGLGMTYRMLVLGGEKLASVCAPTAFSMGFNHGSLRPVLSAGTDEQKALFVRDLLDQRGYAALCLTEPDVSGSNLMSVATTATKIDGGYVIRGTKSMVGNGCNASLFLVLTDTVASGRRQGLSFFAVPLGDGVEVGPNTDKLGFRCVTTPTITFDNVEVSDKHLIGQVGHGEAILLDTLNHIRFGGASVILGVVVGAVKAVMPWLEERKVFPNEPLLQKSHVQLQLGEIYGEMQKVRLMMWRAADRLDQGKRANMETSAAKLSASQLAMKATYEVGQFYGWRAVDNDYDIQKRFRDARATTIYEGTSEIQALNLFRELRRELQLGAEF